MDKVEVGILSVVGIAIGFAFGRHISPPKVLLSPETIRVAVGEMPAPAPVVAVVPGITDDSTAELNRLYDAVCAWENRGTPEGVAWATVHNTDEDAAGEAQIRPCILADIQQFAGLTFTLDDRFDPVQSRAMFILYTTIWNERRGDWSLEGAARRWNGGPRGHLKSSTAPYWAGVRARLQST